MNVLKASFPSIVSSHIIQKHISVQSATEATGYSTQYLRRLLRAGTLVGIRIGQIWLIDMDSFEQYLACARNTSDRRWGPR
jgi:excisionase family DNA binding protein